MQGKLSNPDLCQMIIDILNRHRVKGPEDRWVWQNIHLQFYIELLASAIRFADGIPQHRKRVIVGKSASLVNGQNPISIALLMREISRQERQFLQKNLEHFAVVTSISIQNDLHLSKRRLGSTTLSFHKNVPVRYEHSNFVAWRSRGKDKTPPDGYMAVVLHSIGRTVVDSYNESMDCLDLLRGIWNWLLNLKYPMWRWTSQTRPLNQIRSGPYHTAHFPSGKSAAGTYWYEPNIQARSLEPTDIKKEIWEEVFVAEKYVRRKLIQSPSSAFLTGIFRDYARILDSCDHDGTFLGLWRLLEQLTLKPSEQGNKDRIPRRVSFLFQDSQFTREAAGFLNMYRDNSVHRGEGNPQIYVLIDKLRDYVDIVLRFHLEQKSAFDETIDLLCLSPSTNRLTSEIEIRRKGLRLRGNRPD